MSSIRPPNIKQCHLEEKQLPFKLFMIRKKGIPFPLEKSPPCRSKEKEEHLLLGNYKEDRQKKTVCQPSEVSRDIFRMPNILKQQI